MLVRLAVCSLMASSRLAELAYSRRNLEQVGSSNEGAWSRRTYPFMIGLHTAVLVLTAFRGGKPKARWLALLAASQPVRVWVLWTLRARWNTRGAVPRDVEVAKGGPYRFVRHPNYAVVGVELFALPMAFGVAWLALAGSLANAVLLFIRIRDEERLLRRLPGYNAHFSSKPRFVPGLI